MCLVAHDNLGLCLPVLSQLNHLTSKHQVDRTLFFFTWVQLCSQTNGWPAQYNQTQYQNLTMLQN